LDYHMPYLLYNLVLNYLQWRTDHFVNISLVLFTQIQQRSLPWSILCICRCSTIELSFQISAFCFVWYAWASFKCFLLFNHRSPLG
jgi:hypothetical protein